MTGREDHFDDLATLAALATLLGPAVEPDEETALKERIWLLSTSELARGVRKRRRHKAAGVLAATACFGLGLLSALLIKLPVPPSIPSEQVAAADRPVEPIGGPVTPVPLVEWESERDPRFLEEAAYAADPEERTYLFELAGDRYLEAGQVAAALRCYAAVADSEPAAASDSWLLAALKRNRQEGNDHAPSDG